MIEVLVYSRQDCHLCESALQELGSLQEIVPHQLQVIDVDNDTKLCKQYGNDVPVIIVGPYTLKTSINRQDLEITLRAAQRRDEQLKKIEADLASGAIQLNLKWTGADRFAYWLSRHYLALFNALVFMYMGLPFLAPILQNSGMIVPANWIYKVYSVVCHQLAFRSWFLYGEQFIYPREAAKVANVITYGEAIHQDENDIWTARVFLGNQQVGYKVALCQRDVAIYGGILIFGLIFTLTRSRMPALPWYLWIAIGLLPIGLDGLSQLASQPPLNFLPYRESTPLLRVITGFLFGFFTAWFGYPMVETSMHESREYLELKLRRIQVQKQPEQINNL